MFIFLGIAVGIYTAYAASTGSVYARSRWSGRVIVREESPWLFWTAIASYAALAVALVTIF
jgi:hypothetical protein